MTKHCRKCGLDKNLEEFHSSSRNRDGKQSACKPCTIKMMADCRVKHPETAKRRYHGLRNPNKPWPSEHCSYSAAHLRVKRVRGLASWHSCVDCGQPARDWSYKKGSDKEVVGYHVSRGQVLEAAYSADVSDYEPRCKPCHIKFDRC